MVFVSRRDRTGFVAKRWRGGQRTPGGRPFPPLPAPTSSMAMESDPSWRTLRDSMDATDEVSGGPGAAPVAGRPAKPLRSHAALGLPVWVRSTAAAPPDLVFGDLARSTRETEPRTAGPPAESSATATNKRSSVRRPRRRRRRSGRVGKGARRHDEREHGRSGRQDGRRPAPQALTQRRTPGRRVAEAAARRARPATADVLAPNRAPRRAAQPLIQALVDRLTASASGLEHAAGPGMAAMRYPSTP